MLHDSQLRHSNNIKVITSTVSEAGVLVLEMGGIYEIYHCDSLKWNDIHPKFLDNEFRQSSITKITTSTI
jgi:hypothetical protein